MPEWELKQLDTNGDSWHAVKKPSTDDLEVKASNQKAVNGVTLIDLLYWLLSHNFIESLQSNIDIIEEEFPNLGISLSLYLEP